MRIPAKYLTLMKNPFGLRTKWSKTKTKTIEQKTERTETMNMKRSITAQLNGLENNNDTARSLTDKVEQRKPQSAVGPTIPPAPFQNVKELHTLRKHKYHIMLFNGAVLVEQDLRTTLTGPQYNDRNRYYVLKRPLPEWDGQSTPARWTPARHLSVAEFRQIIAAQPSWDELRSVYAFMSEENYIDKFGAQASKIDYQHFDPVVVW